MGKKAVILLSGGLDSTTMLAIAKSQGFDVYVISFRYGQRHTFELIAAKTVADFLGVKKHLILDVDLGSIGGSALTDDIDVPKGRDESQMASNIPITYVPARNTIFLSLALGWAEVLGARDIFIGANVVDYSGYPDCRPGFISAFEKMANLGTKAGVEGDGFTIHAPLSQMTKAEIIRKGIELGVDYSLTLSCYDPTENGGACGECDSCLLRKKGFEEAGIADPTVYR
ncbi:7-cyano-7-deazaguanine synthase QueC [candidate division KSB1 bacterium]|nr:7-cyano-7-deazaguanine synthase QueC [candidate division KSB1 bacterium]MBL7094561.1 7-cyano-7-deazaguanine synthase QueC [candidate division KSB1 bacterium]